jgi:hypothetical protein
LRKQEGLTKFLNWYFLKKLKAKIPHCIILKFFASTSYIKSKTFQAPNTRECVRSCNKCLCFPASVSHFSHPATVLQFDKKNRVLNYEKLIIFLHSFISHSHSPPLDTEKHKLMNENSSHKMRARGNATLLDFQCRSY